jgi:broad specificity phosphatase PhoE
MVTSRNERSAKRPHDHEIVLVRHAETPFNIEQRLRGRADPPLSPRGVRQAESLAASFDPFPPAVIVTSPRRRALETGVTIARRQRVAISIDERLDDLDYGAWTGLGPAELRARWPELYERYLHDPARVQFPGGETVVAAQERAWTLVAELARVDRPDRVALVTHDAIIRLVVCKLMGAPIATMHGLTVALASTTGISVSAGEPRIAWLDHELGQEG